MKKMLLPLAVAVFGLATVFTSCGSPLEKDYWVVNFNNPAGSNPNSINVSKASGKLTDSEIPITSTAAWDLVGWFDSEGKMLSTDYVVSDNTTFEAKWRILPECITQTTADDPIQMELEFENCGANASTEVKELYRKVGDESFSSCSDFTSSSIKIKGDASKTVQYYAMFRCSGQSELYKSNIMTIKRVDSSNSKIGQYKTTTDVTSSVTAANYNDIVGIIIDEDENHNPKTVMSIRVNDSSKKWCILYTDAELSKDSTLVDPVGYRMDYKKIKPAITLNDGYANYKLAKKLYTDINETGKYPALDSLKTEGGPLPSSSPDTCWYIPSRDEAIQIYANRKLLISNLEAANTTCSSASKYIAKMIDSEKIVSSSVMYSSWFTLKFKNSLDTGNNGLGRYESMQNGGYVRPVTKVNW